MAPRLAGRVGRNVLIKACRTRFKPAHHLSFLKAEQIDDPRYAPTELYRRRMLGETSGWGRALHPFDPEDFAPGFDRPGLPISFTEFYAHVPDELAFLDAGRQTQLGPATGGATMAIPTTRSLLRMVSKWS
jgi:hypothetical protein